MHKSFEAMTAHYLTAPSQLALQVDLPTWLHISVQHAMRMALRERAQHGTHVAGSLHHGGGGVTLQQQHRQQQQNSL